MRRDGALRSWYTGIVEAGWLAALLAVPLFFNTYSMRSFEPDKAALLRSLVALMVLAWFLRLAAGPFFANRAGPTRRRLVDLQGVSVPVLLATALFVAQIISTGFSISPFESLWGSYHRQQGLDTAAAYFVILLSVVGLVRNRVQTERIITALLVGSAAIAFYGILQHSGLDPVRPLGPGRSPVRSTMGNEIFVAAYLIMIIPLTVGRLIEAASHICADRRRPGLVALLVGVGVAASVATLVAGWWLSVIGGIIAAAAVGIGWIVAAIVGGGRNIRSTGITAYSVILSLQLGCVILSESRGPFLGLLAGLFLLAFLLTVIYRKYRWFVFLAAASAFVIVLLILVNVPGSPVQWLQDVPVLGRLTRVLTTEGPAQVRLLIWESAADLLASEPGRLFFGYGQDAFRLAIAPYYRAELGPLTGPNLVPDRAHNQTFDLLIENGVLGAALYYALVMGLIYVGLRKIRIIGKMTDGAAFIVLSITVMAAGLMGARLLDQSWRFVGLVVPAAILVGAIVTIARSAIVGLTERGSRESSAAAPRSCVFVACLLSALVAHLVEVHLGIATISTKLVFWIIAALLVVSTSHVAADTVTAERSGTDLGTAVMLVALAVTTLNFDFLETGTAHQVSTGFSWAFAGSFILWGILLSAETGIGREMTSKPIRVLEFVGVYGAFGIGSLLASRTAFTLPFPERLDILPALPMFLGVVLCLTAALAVTVNKPMRLVRPAVLLTGAGMFAATFVIGWKGNFESIQANIFMKEGWLTQIKSGEPERILEWYSRAVELEPFQAVYHELVGRTYSDQAVRSPGEITRDRLFLKARASIEEAHRLEPRDPAYIASLARLYLRWGRTTRDADMRHHRLGQALTHYSTAIEMSPERAVFWTGKGEAYAALKQFEPAARMLEKSLAYYPGDARTLAFLGQAYIALNQWSEARHILERLLLEVPKNVEIRQALASVYERMGKIDNAIGMYRSILFLDPGNSHARRRLDSLSD